MRWCGGVAPASRMVSMRLLHTVLALLGTAWCAVAMSADDSGSDTDSEGIMTAAAVAGMTAACVMTEFVADALLPRKRKILSLTAPC